MMNIPEEFKGSQKLNRDIKKDTYMLRNIVSTIFAGDTMKFETCALDHRYINDGVILEEYDNEESAICGHEKWLKLLNNHNPPPTLINMSTSKFDHHGFKKEFNIIK